MIGLQLADEIIDRISERDGRYDPQAYLFVLAALEYCQQRRPERGHISGEELAWACRDFARDQFGLTAPSVMKHWGIGNTGDIGRIVYTLIDIGLPTSEPQDRLEDFDDVYQFAEALEGEYPWLGVNRTGGAT
jgi:uncharacterized repeat protein (TIGR04138 family)